MARLPFSPGVGQNRVPLEQGSHFTIAIGAKVGSPWRVAKIGLRSWAQGGSYCSPLCFFLKNWWDCKIKPHFSHNKCLSTVNKSCDGVWNIHHCFSFLMHPIIICEKRKWERSVCTREVLKLLLQKYPQSTIKKIMCTDDWCQFLKG